MILTQEEQQFLRGNILMIDRITVSSSVETKIQTILDSSGFATKATVIRLALSLGIKYSDKCFDYQFEDKSGGTYTRNVIFQGKDDVYFSLIKMVEERYIDESDIIIKFLPKYLNFGIEILHEKFVNNNQESSLKWLLSEVE